MRATIRFLTPEQGGRSKLPHGRRYTALCVLDGEPSSPDAWSLMVEFDGPLEGNVASGNVRYVAAEAPHARLQEVRRFALYEGQKHVADGVVR